MPQRQVYARRRGSVAAKSSFGCTATSLCGILFIIFLCAVVSDINASPTAQAFLGLFSILVILAPIVAVVWGIVRYVRKKEAQKQAILWQQQEYARLQYQQQEQERLARLEQERQERERLAMLNSLGDILVLTPREFEELTGKILAAYGYQHVQHRGGSGDLGADLTAYDINNNEVIVQCKRYAPGNMVGSPAIQTFIGMMHVHHQVKKGIFVTTSKFTKPATQLADTHDILLIDGEMMVQMIQSMQQRMTQA